MRIRLVHHLASAGMRAALALGAFSASASELAQGDPKHGRAIYEPRCEELRP